MAGHWPALQSRSALLVQRLTELLLSGSAAFVTGWVREGDVLAGKYQVERVIGQGGMGMVVAALHLKLGQRVALKFLLPGAHDNPEAVERFLREARAAARIQGEHVARVSDVGTLESGAPYMVMELLQGVDLSVLLERRGPLPMEEAVAYLLQAAEAIAEAHALGIVHRDLKPSNLFLSQRPDGSPLVKVLDFGISKALAGHSLAGAAPNLTSTTAVMGSPLYMSPEQIRASRDVDARADIWALGIILHELLAGVPPYVAETAPALLAMIVADPPPPLRVSRPDAPAELEAVLLRCLEKDRTRRWASIAELASALRPFAPRESLTSVDRVARILGQSTKTLPGSNSDATAGAHRPAQAGAQASTASAASLASTAHPNEPPAAPWRWILASGVAFALAALGVALWLRVSADDAAGLATAVSAAPASRPTAIPDPPGDRKLADVVAPTPTPPQPSPATALASPAPSAPTALSRSTVRPAKAPRTPSVEPHRPESATVASPSTSPRRPAGPAEIDAALDQRR